MVRVAVVGAGHWGPNFITNFRTSERSELVRVVDSDARRLEEVRRRFPDVATSRDASSAFDDPEIDAVVIATPTRTHFELTRAALAAGKHVLVEKPMADTVRAAEDLCARAKAAGRVLLVGHVFLYNAAARFVKQAIDAGDLGRVYYLDMVRTNLGPIRIDVNAAWDLAAHDVSLASHWLGAQPRTVSARGGAWINAGVEDAVFATLRYPDDVLVNLHASWLHPRKSRDITVVGEARMLTFDDIDAETPIRIYDKQVSSEREQVSFVDTFESFRTVVLEGKVRTPNIALAQPLRTECEHFLDCVIDGVEPLSGPDEGLAVVRVLDAISRSLAQRGRETAVAE